MMSTLVTKLGAFAVAPFLFFGAHGQADISHKAKAQEPSGSEAVCTTLEHNLYIGLRDRGTDGEVSELQAFLKAEGYMSNASTGVYGVSTYKAVREFQKDNDIRATGAVYGATRAAIEDMSCDETDGSLSITGIDAPSSLMTDEEGTWTVDTESSGEGSLHYSVVWGDENTFARFFSMEEKTQSSATFTHTYASEGTYTPRFTVTDDEGNTVSEDAATVTVSDDADQDVTITSLSSTSGYAGDTITVTGAGFAADSDVYVGGTKVDADVASDTSLTFKVPSIGKGSYDVYVENENGTSNTLRFELKEKSVRVSVSGVSAPTRLSVDEEGTWTVNADTNADQLTYSVNWGDENGSMFRGKSAETVQSSSTFTHSYAKEGTYKPTFTVSDGTGHSSKVSATVVVTK